ncbi:uncharacterized protein EHS24_006323 [Apiotrichum porosum]|uniref:Uncharacterized protein n=1 Tax=Apiotrichum porosum TaxID=105984 RepID=A0A427Y142_9TREE|nr:uncharacterized protein EHS24_006323 [Apiotrichum porosum]RSH84797.1 hypothetical protein EHS24_006323 [Apiotrichum porosum]
MSSPSRPPIRSRDNAEASRQVKTGGGSMLRYKTSEFVSLQNGQQNSSFQPTALDKDKPASQLLSRVCAYTDYEKH